MFEFLKNGYHKIKQTAQRVWGDKEARKEILMDAAVIAPYVVTDTILYYSAFLHFLSEMASDPKHPENESWYSAAYYIGAAGNVILAAALFLAFSDTASHLLKIKDNEYQAMKYKARRVIGVPGSLIKVCTGEMSLYLHLAAIMDKRAAIGISSFFGTMAVSALTSFLWSNHTKSSDSKVEEEKHSHTKTKIIKSIFVYVSSLCYAIDVGFVYLNSSVNIGKNMGLIDHDFIHYKNGPERAALAIIVSGAIIETTAVYIAFARTNANMFGLISNKTDDKGVWSKIENSYIKKGIGSFAVLFKIYNTAVSAYNFFHQRHVPNGFTIPFDVYSSTAGILAQSSLLVADPLRKLKTINEQQDVELGEGKTSKSKNQTSDEQHAMKQLPALSVINDKKNSDKDKKLLPTIEMKEIEQSIVPKSP